MPIYTPTAKDLSRGTLVDPDWYRVRILSIGERPSKDGGSVNFPVEAKVICNASNGSTADGVGGLDIEWNFNSKAMGFCVGFLKALGVEVEIDKHYDLGMAAGKDIEVYIARGEYNGVPKNDIQHKYRPVSQ